MNWQIFGIIIGLTTVFLSVLGHAVTMAWWASKINGTVEKLNGMIDEQKRQFEERDKQFAKLWEKHDHLKDRVTVLEANHGQSHQAHL
jgi:cell division protein FtsL